MTHKGTPTRRQALDRYCFVLRRLGAIASELEAAATDARLAASDLEPWMASMPLTAQNDIVSTLLSAEDAAAAIPLACTCEALERDLDKWEAAEFGRLGGEGP